MMYPLKFKPIYKEKIWGGDHLKRIFGREIPSCQIGESWDLSSHHHGMSIVANGDLAGLSLDELMTKYKDELMGSQHKNMKIFPLLIKIIDANDNLSIQVHPEDQDAYRGGEFGKTEAWYVVYAKENAQIIYGLQDDITKEDFVRAIKNNAIAKTLKKVHVKVGDMIFVPAGTIHALLDGVMVYEVQQNSDTTYRIYDYDRLDAVGKGRELQIEKALNTIHFGRQPSCVFPDEKIKCQYFSMEKLVVSGEKEEKTNNAFMIYCIITGSGAIQYKQAMEPLYPGDTILIPASLEKVIVKGELTLLKIT
ncbi:type I phosphomannose isomerase catalytic subunit [Pelosinus sp. sgz500959]|uniref:type I phosphomannose isomerase catalytic subunit n=1 Tax=Pelosinus sp. sgz500959 TaxID=3242472 RepID=UPI00366DC3DC